MPFGANLPTMQGYVDQGKEIARGAGLQTTLPGQGAGQGIARPGGGTYGRKPAAAAPAPAPQQPKAPTAPRTQPHGYVAQDGFDMSRAGAAEHAYADNSGQLQAPSASEQYAAQPGRFQGEFDQTAAGQYWNSMQGANNAPKDMSAYYDRAYETGANRINSQAASRGMFSSSHALDSLGSFGADLGAQQAKDEAGYDLQRRQLDDQIQRGAATAADASAVGRFNSQLGAAGQSDEGMLGRLGLLGEGAASADNSRSNRVNSVFDNVATTAGLVSGQVAGQYNDTFDSDGGLFDAGQEMGLGAGLQNLNGVQSVGQGRQAGTAATSAAIGQDAQTAITVGKALYGMG